MQPCGERINSSAPRRIFLPTVVAQVESLLMRLSPSTGTRVALRDAPKGITRLDVWKMYSVLLSSYPVL